MYNKLNDFVYLCIAITYAIYLMVLFPLLSSNLFFKTFTEL